MAVDVGAFYLGWLAFGLLQWHASGLDLSVLLGALVLPSAVIAWWSAGWCNAQEEGRASFLGAGAQGAAWGGFFAVTLALAVFFVGASGFPRTIAPQELVSLSRFVGYMALAGSVTLLLLSLANAFLFRLAALLGRNHARRSEA